MDQKEVAETIKAPAKKFFQKWNLTPIVIALLTFAIGWQLGHYDLSLQWKEYKPTFALTDQQPPKDKESIDFKLFWDTWDLVAKEYVDKKAIDPQKMYYGAIQGMVAAVGDPYTVFLVPEAQKSTKEELGGSFEGVGIQLGFNKDKRLVVQAPLDGTPAAKAGIKAGDYIVKINGKDATGLSLPEAVSQIRGEKGTKITLQIFREGEDKPRDMELVRDTIIVKSVEGSTKTTSNGKSVYYIKLSRFGERTFTEWNEAVSDALASGAKGIILDVRNNPGGFLDGAVFIGSEFVEKGDIVLSEDGKGNRDHFEVNRKGKLLNLPMVILVNKGSASASEIVSGAMQDYKRAKLVGEQTFGKGTIQESKEMPGGTGIHITTAKWLTPNGRWVHNTGLTPDVVVEQKSDDPKVDEQLDKALELLN